MLETFYKDRTVFLTGGTGFLGQALAAKMLRCLPGIRRIYVLIRPGKSAGGAVVTPAQRLGPDLLESSIFARFRQEDPSGFAAVSDKLVAVGGDVTAPGLGLDEETRRRLIDEVDLIIGSAATVVFDEPLDLSMQLNSLGPLALLEIAKASKRRVDFVHVSTAYVNGQRSGLIPDEILPLDRNPRQMMDGPGDRDPFDPEAELEACRGACEAIRQRAFSEEQQQQFRRDIQTNSRRGRLPAKRLEQLAGDRTRRWLERELVDEGMRRAKANGWNDVYTFTKAMGEQLLVKERGDIPLVIVRPSIIESSLNDPEPGWITGLKVADPLIAAYGRGMLPDFPARPELTLDLIPVDIVANTILVGATQADAGRPQVFQVATSAENPISIRRLFELVRRYFKDNPMLDRQGKAPPLHQWKFPSIRTFQLAFKCRFLWPVNVQQWLFTRLPASLTPASKKRLLTTAKIRLNRVLYFTDIYYPYTHLDCVYQTGRLGALRDGMSPKEREQFNLDVKGIDWEDYVYGVHLPGLRRHVLKDEESLFRQAPEEVGAAEERWRAEEELETIADMLRWACANYGDNIALQMEREEGWVRLSYAQLLQRAETMARHWQAAGLTGGQRVLLCAQNGPEWVVGYMAATILGLAVVPLDPQTRGEDVSRLVDFVDAGAIIATAQAMERLADFCSDRLLRFNLDNMGAPFGQDTDVGGAVSKGDWRPPRVGAESVASIIFTAGMADEPRGAVLTQGNIIANLLALAAVQPVEQDDQVLSLLPLHHGLEFTGGLLLPLLGGATITYLATINSREILRAIQVTSTTALLAVPRLLQVLSDRIQRLGRHKPEDCGLDSLRLVVSGGAPLATEIYQAYRRLGIRVLEGYGLTEAGPIVAVNPSQRCKAGSVGQVLPGQEVSIVAPDEEGRGEIRVRGANIMSEYFKKPLLTQEVLRDGWLYTGDLGYLDEEGYLYITGRSKDMIVTGAGKNVYPSEVEELYRELPHIAELSVVGVRSPRTLGEELHGVAVLQRNLEQVGGEKPEDQVMAAVYSISRNLPSYQRLQRLHIWRRPLPRVADGPVDRAALLAELQLERNQSVDLPDLDESLPPWERQVYGLVSQIAGLTPGEVVAHAEAPLDTLLDSLMGVELAALIGRHFGIETNPIDRGRSLRNILGEIESQLEEPQVLPAVLERGENYWAALLHNGGSGTQVRGIGQRLLQPLVWGALGPLLRGYWGVEVEGTDFLPQDRPYFIAANHSSHLDGAAVFLAVRPHVECLSVSVARDYYEQSAPLAWVLGNLLNGVAFDRRRNFAQGLVQIKSRLGRRRPVLIFPEGSRSANGQVQPFKSGVALLAFELGIPIVPVHISGTEQAWPKGQRWPQRHPVRLRLGLPLETAAYKDRLNRLSNYEIYREISEALHRQIEALGRT